MKLNSLTFIFIISLTALIPFTLQAQERFVEVDGTKIWLNTIATENRKPGQPLIIFESGHGTPMGNWNTVVDKVSVFAPVLTYDRPGVGESEEDDELPTVENVSNKLVKLLNKLELAPPFILVGHSLGGVYVRGFANYYPEHLAGLIIVDPADFTETLEDRPAYYAKLGLSSNQVDSLINHFVQRRLNRRADYPKGIGEETEVLEALRADNFQELNATPPPNIPIHMLIGGRFDMPQKFRSKVYDDELLFRTKEARRMERYTQFVQSVANGMLLYSAKSGHFVHRDDPELLLASVQMMLVEAAKGQ